MVKYDKEKDELLIESIQCYSAIYNKYDKEHKDHIYKHKCWENISQIVELPIPECKKRWKSLRDQYQKKLKEGSTNWDYMNLMSFLTEPPERRRSIEVTVIDPLSTVLKTEVNTDVDSESDNTETTHIEFNTGLDPEREVYAESRHTAHENIDDTDASPGPSSAKKMKASKLQETMHRRKSQRQLLEALVNNTQKPPQVQPLSAMKKFFDSMAEVVEKFPTREQALVRAKVCQIITDTEIKLLEDH